jgi:hypothetical protein
MNGIPVCVVVFQMECTSHSLVLVALILSEQRRKREGNCPTAFLTQQGGSHLHGAKSNRMGYDARCILRALLGGVGEK